MEYINTMTLLKERNNELLSYYMEVDDFEKINLHFVIKSILSANKPFSKLNPDVSINILKDLKFSDAVVFDMYKILLLKA